MDSLALNLTSPPPQRSATIECAGIGGFMEFLHKLLHKAWGEGTFVLTEEYPQATDANEIAQPIIVWDVEEERIAVGEGHRPRLRQEGYDENAQDEYVQIYAQNFDVILTFRIYCSARSELRELLEKFKDFMMWHVGEFKRKGLKQLIYAGQVISDTDRSWRGQAIAFKELRYKVSIEKQWTVRLTILRQVTTEVDVRTAGEEQQDDVAPIMQVQYTQDSPVIPDSD